MFNNCIEAQDEFEKCWNNPEYTQVIVNDVDVNKTLSFYTINKPLLFTAIYITKYSPDYFHIIINQV